MLSRIRWIIISFLLGCGQPFEPPPCPPTAPADTLWAFDETRSDSIRITVRQGRCTPTGDRP